MYDGPVLLTDLLYSIGISQMKLRQLQREPKKKLLTVKVTQSDLDIIRDKAKLYTDGNISEWIRYSATALLPKARDLVNEDDKDSLQGV